MLSFKKKNDSKLTANKILSENINNSVEFINWALKISTGFKY
jgi:hypothetical protein